MAPETAATLLYTAAHPLDFTVLVEELADILPNGTCTDAPEGGGAALSFGSQTSSCTIEVAINAQGPDRATVRVAARGSDRIRRDATCYELAAMLLDAVPAAQVYWHPEEVHLSVATFLDLCDPDDLPDLPQTDHPAAARGAPCEATADPVPSLSPTAAPDRHINPSHMNPSHMAPGRDMISPAVPSNAAPLRQGRMPRLQPQTFERLDAACAAAIGPTRTRRGEATADLVAVIGRDTPAAGAETPRDSGFLSRLSTNPIVGRKTAPVPFDQLKSELRAALAAQKRKRRQAADAGAETSAPDLPLHLTVYTMTATLLLLAFPVGFGVLIYNVLGGVSIRATAHALAMTGTGSAVASTSLIDVVRAFL